MSEAYTGVGTLSDEKTVILDKPVSLPPGRVRVIVERLADEQPEDNWLDRLRTIRRALSESGYRPRTRKEIDAYLSAERDSWDS
jgi:hypothetical protein